MIKSSTYRVIDGIGTSKEKTDSFVVHGGKGIFLSAIAALAIVKIVSRDHVSEYPASMTVHRSQHRIHCISSTEECLAHPTGTRVEVLDLFGNMPVRLKQLIGSDRLLAKTAEHTITALKLGLAALVSSWHWPVNLTLQLAGRDGNLLKYSGPAPEETCSQKRRPRLLIQSIEQFPHPNKDRILDAFSQSRLSSHLNRSHWVDISAQSSSVLAQGFICLTPAPSKHVQVISFGVRPILRSDESGILYDEINQIFAASNFGAIEIEENFQTASASRQESTLYRPSDYAKGIGKWPMFHIRIVPHGKIDKDWKESGRLESIRKAIYAIFHHFLVKFHFKPQREKSRKSRARTSGSPSTNRPPRRIAAADVYDSSGRTKSARLATSNPNYIVPVSQQRTDSTQHEQSTSLNSKEFELLTSHGTRAIDSLHLQNQNEPNQTRQILVPQESNAMNGDEERKQRSERPIREILANWNNPVFKFTERSLIQTATSQYLGSNDSLQQQSTSNQVIVGGHLPTDWKASSFSKLSLASSRIVAQVDRKFILVSMADEDSTLVLIDQHAADERIRLEILLQDLRSQRPLLLTASVPLSLSGDEVESLIINEEYFRAWGLEFRAPSIISGKISSLPETAEVEINSLPRAIASRCLADPRTLAGLIHKLAWQTANMARKPDRHVPPPAIMEMINSRACRSAIMFNDELTLPECEALVRRLARTEFPFQCAHGRPSIVPLIALGSLAHETTDVRQPSESTSNPRCVQEEIIPMMRWKQWLAGSTRQS